MRIQDIIKWNYLTMRLVQTEEQGKMVWARDIDLFTTNVPSQPDHQHYRVNDQTFPVVESLNDLGRDDWELVAIQTDGLYIFKRPVITQ